jgi:hypothetical protein
VRSLPPLSVEEVVATYPTYRQSILSTADSCLLSTRFDLESASYTNAAQARGIIAHRFLAEYLRTLWRTGESQMSTEEAMVILREVARQRDVPDEDVVLVPARERRLLRIVVLRIAQTPLNMTRLIDVERQLKMVVSYTRDDGRTITRMVTGRPDAVLADPPGGAIVLDLKTAPSAPAAVPEDYDGSDGDHLHVSVGGYWQQKTYGALLLANYPSLERVTLREWYPLPDEVREATVTRAQMEHIEHELSTIVELLDRALEGGSRSPIWAPSPGSWCAYCERPTACPIDLTARVTQGGLTSDAQARKVAAETTVATAVRSEGLKAMKSYHEATGRPIPVSNAKTRSEYRWTKDAAGKRRFKLTTPARVDAGDRELDAAFEEAATTRAMLLAAQTRSASARKAAKTRKRRRNGGS